MPTRTYWRPVLHSSVYGLGDIHIKSALSDRYSWRERDASVPEACGGFQRGFPAEEVPAFSSLPIVRFSKSAFNRDSPDGSLGEAAALAACNTESSLSVPHALR